MRTTVALAMASSALFAQVDITGTVTDQSSNSIEGATVELVGEGISTTTDASGEYHLESQTTTVPRGVPAHSSKVGVRNGRIQLALATSASVTVSVFDARGALIVQPFNELLRGGNHSAPLLSAGDAHNVLVIRARIDDRTDLFTHMPVGQGWQKELTDLTTNCSMAKATAVVDTIRASKTGYLTEAVAIEQLTGTVDIVLDAEVVEGEYITTLEAHGLTDLTDVAQVRAAFAAAVADASTNASRSSTKRGVVELEPGTVYVCMPATNGGPDNGGPTLNNQEGAIELNSSTPNVEIRTRGKPPVGGNQAVLRMDDWDDYGSADPVHNRAIIAARSAENCVVGWVELDGNRLSCGANRSQRLTWLQNNIRYDYGGNGGIYNISFYGATGCRMYHVDSHDALNDGLLIRRNTETGDIFTDFVAEDCDFHHNRRQGCSAEEFQNTSDTWDAVVFRRCKFRETGEQDEIPGEAPADGFDLEPLHTTGRIYGLTFDDCDFSDNHGHTITSGSIHTHRGSRGFDVGGSQITRYLRWTDCRFERNRTCGMIFVTRNPDPPQALDHELLNCTFRDNGTESGSPANHILFKGYKAGEGLATYVRFIAGNNEFTVGGSPGGGYNFMSSCADAGHDITIYKGDYEPNVITNGQKTITVRDGLAQ